MNIISNKKLIRGKYIDVLLRSSQTVFTNKDMAILWCDNDHKAIVSRLKQYVKSGSLIRLRRGIYVKDNNYNKLELATRINMPSYVSFETVLTRSGVNFQYYSNIYIASYLNREIIIDKQKYSFVRMKDYVLSNTLGINHTDGMPIATAERAFLDRLYVDKDYYVDNIRSLNWEKVLEISKIYHNKRLENKVKEYYKQYKTA